jgi:hypothetical protein
MRTLLVDPASALNTKFAGTGQATNAALLSQAADQGDPTADLVLGVLIAGGNLTRPIPDEQADRTTLVTARFLRVGDSDASMISAWIGLMLVNPGGQSEQLLKITGLPADPEHGLRILRHQAERGDEAALDILFFLYVEQPTLRG